MHLSFDDFLEHYGVLGMKWGVRKDDRGGQQPKKRRTAMDWIDEQNRRKKEMSKIDNRYGSQFNRQTKRLTKAEQRGKLNTKKYIKLSAKRDALAKRWLEETAVLSRMTMDDFKKEDRYIGKKVVQSLLLNAGANTAATLAGIPVRAIYVPDTTSLRSNYRLGLLDEKVPKK